MTRRVSLKLEVTFIDEEDTGLVPLDEIVKLIAQKMRHPTREAGFPDAGSGTVMTVHNLHGRAGTKALLIATNELTHSYEQ